MSWIKLDDQFSINDNLRSCVEDDEMDNLAWVEEAKAFLDGAAHD